METLQRTANRGSISTGFNIDNSCVFEADNSEKLSRNQTTGTNRKKFTVSFWVKRSEIAAFQVLACAEASGNDISFLDFESDDKLRFRDTASASNQCVLETDREFTDTSAWYHIVLRVDTTDSTADDRARIYVNGQQETSFNTRTNFDLNDDTFWGYNGGSLTFGNALNEANYYSGYVAEAVYVDGQSLAPTEFGETDSDTGIWKPIDVSGLTFGNNGYYLDFEDSSNMGNDKSGGTDFTETNITSADQSTDTPTNNFCIVNNLTRQGNQYGAYNTGQQASNGGTVIREPTGSFGQISGTFGLGAGKWYWEVKAIQGSGLNTQIYGITSPVNLGGSEAARAEIYPGSTASEDTSAQYSIYPLYADQSRSYRGDSDSSANWTSSDEGSADDTIWRIALDLDNGKIWYGRNNVWLPDKDTDTASNPSTGSNARDTDLLGSTRLVNGFYLPSFGMYNENSGHTMQTNFGGYSIISNSKSYSDGNGYGAFVYEVPTGFYSICSKNLAEYG